MAGRRIPGEPHSAMMPSLPPPGVTVTGATPPAAGPFPLMEEAVTQLTTARELYRQGDLEQARRTAARAEKAARRLADLPPSGRASLPAPAGLAGGAAVIVGLCQAALGKHRAASQAFERAAGALRTLDPQPSRNRQQAVDLGIALAHSRRREDLELAVSLLEDVVLARYDHPDPLRELGRSLLALHRPEEAVGPLRAAVDAAPGDWQAAELYATAVRRTADSGAAAAAWVTAAETAGRAGLDEFALRAAELAAKLDPGNVEAVTLLCRLLDAAGREEEAIQAARAADEARPSGAVKSLIARLLADQSQLEDALAVVDAGLATDPTHRALLTGKAEILLDAGRPAEAVGIAAQLARSHPDDAYALQLHGRALRELADYPGAVTAFEAEVALDPENAGARARLGHALALAGDLAAARQYLDRALQLSEDDTYALAWRAMVRAELADYAGAAVDAARVVELAPDDADSWDLLARLRVQLGDHAGAEAAYQRLTALAPDYAPGWLGYGYALLLSDRYGEARDAYRRAAELTSGSAAALAGQAEATVYLDDPDLVPEAEELARRVIALGDPDVPGHTQLGLALHRQGRHAEALAALDAALAADPADVLALATRGEVLLALDRPAEAVEVLSRAAGYAPDQVGVQTRLVDAGVRLLDESPAADQPELWRRLLEPLDAVAALVPGDDPDYYGYFALLGQARLETGDFDGAEHAVRRALRAVPGDPDVLTVLGDVRQVQDRYDEAGDLYRQVLDAVPGHAGALIGLANVRYLAGRYDEAVALLEPVADGASDLADLHNILGASYQALGRREAARREMDRAVAVAELPVALVNRAGLLLELGEPTSALADAERAMELDPRDASARDQWRIALMALGRQDEAVDRLTALAERFPDDPSLRIELADALRVAGRTERAVAAIEQVLWDRPDDPWALRVAAGALLAAGRNEEAVASLERAATIAGDAATWVDLAEVQISTGQLAGGLASLDASLAAGPTRRALVAKGWLLCEVADYRGAAEAGRAALALPPLDVSAPGLLGWALDHGGGDLDEYLALTERAVELDRSDPWIRKQHGNALWLRGDPAAAAPSYQRAIELVDAAGGEDGGTRGWCLLRLGRHEEATEALRGMLGRVTDPVPVLFDLGLTALESGNAERAEDAYRRGLDQLARASSPRARGTLAVGADDLRRSIERGLVADAEQGGAVLRRLEEAFEASPTL
ncbi:MAG: tetratricopeptide repeat protein [Mycobacteriales bacterium]